MQTDVYKTDEYKRKEYRRELIWGPLRLSIGFLQLAFAPLAIYLLFANGIEQFSTWLLIALASLLTGISRLLYGGRKNLKANKLFSFD